MKVEIRNLGQVSIHVVGEGISLGQGDSAVVDHTAILLAESPTDMFHDAIHWLRGETSAPRSPTQSPVQAPVISDVSVSTQHQESDHVA